MHAPPRSESKAAPMTSSWHAGGSNGTQRYAQVPGNSYFGDTPPRHVPPSSGAADGDGSAFVTSASLATPPPAPAMLRGGSEMTPGLTTPSQPPPEHPQSTTEAIASARSQWSMQGSAEGGQVLEDRRRVMAQQASEGGTQQGGMQARMSNTGYMSQTLTSTVQLEKVSETVGRVK